MCLCYNMQIEDFTSKFVNTTHLDFAMSSSFYFPPPFLVDGKKCPTMTFDKTWESGFRSNDRLRKSLLGLSQEYIWVLFQISNSGDVGATKIHTAGHKK